MCPLNYTDCMNEPQGCSRTFNLCGGICNNIRQDQSAEPPTVPNPQAKTDSAMIDACPTNTSCTPITIITTTTVSPNSTASIIGQNCSNVTSVILYTITMTQEMTLIITHTTTPTPWTTQCPQTTTELMTTTTTKKSEESESMPCTSITSTKFIATTVLSLIQSCAPQFTTSPKLNITKSPTTSLGSKFCSGNKLDVPTQRNCSSSTTSALGALLGLSLVLLALVSIGWVWTCWTARKRGEVNINSKTNK